MTVMITLLAWITVTQNVATETPEGFACVSSLEIPEFPRMFRLARLHGRVESVVRLNSEAKISSIETSGSFPPEAVREVLGRSVFKKSCAGGQFKIIFEFVVSGRSQVQPARTVTITGPNSVRIRVNPPPVDQ